MLAFYPCPPLLGRVPPDRHAVIEASAGTGKTYTIEQSGEENGAVTRLGRQDLQSIRLGAKGLRQRFD